MSADRAGRLANEARERSTVNIAARSRGEDMQGLVQHLRATGQLNAGLILRALLSGNLELFDSALAELADLPLARVTALLHDRGGASLQALLIRAGLPGIDLRGVPRRARGQPRDRLCRYARRSGETAPPHGRARADPLRDRPANPPSRY